MRRAVAAGSLYFGIVFALGFVLGVVRTLAVEPAFGKTLGVVVELPVMLTASWWVCRRLMRRMGVAGIHEAALMGALAFVLLMGAEAAMSVLLFGRTLSAHLALYAEPADLLGLVGQVVFAILPLIVPEGRASTSRA
jgi:hypothetical protein